ncbi:MAG: SDR family NAD(P)-dependent oxidoreductase [Actinomycetia bacterium]|nr:SDR family NAD(P)-dependent oxidoreductase [Actinomycetes bacterium]
MTTPSTAAVVTGCSSGIGRAVALRLAAAGYPVYATARRVDTLADLADAGLPTLPLDVDDEASMVAAVDRVVADHGAVGVLVNNAGFALQGTVEETSLDDVRRQFETNVFGLVRLTQLVLPGMRDQGFGRVVNIGSMGGRFTFPGGGFYHASKHALEAVSDALRLEVEAFGVRVSLVQPGPVRSAFADTAVRSIGEGDGPYAQFRRDLARRYSAAYERGATTWAISPDEVAKVVVEAVHSRRPRPRYAVGVVARSLLAARRVAPDRVWDGLVRAQWPTPGGRQSRRRSSAA